MRVLKFRKLETEKDYDRITEIIKTNKLYCSKLWNLNDGMEGVYETPFKDEENILRNFFEKDNYVICAFSNITELNNNLLWGYYANGGKGIAIEIEITLEKLKFDEKVKKITYYNNSPITISDMEQVILAKLSSWQHENEIRFLKNKSEEGLYKIGKVVKIHFGTPYRYVENYDKIKRKSKSLQKYTRWSRKLAKFCKVKKIKIE